MMSVYKIITAEPNQQEQLVQNSLSFSKRLGRPAGGVRAGRDLTRGRVPGRTVDASTTPPRRLGDRRCRGFFRRCSPVNPLDKLLGSVFGLRCVSPRIPMYSAARCSGVFGFYHESGKSWVGSVSETHPIFSNPSGTMPFTSSVL